VQPRPLRGGDLKLEAGAAFDALRPPLPELIATCVHCGWCLPTCPTYLLWGEEMDSPRGRIVLMRHGLEAGSDMAAMAPHFDRCLGCMACVTACPSGVQYDRLIEATRPQVERRHRRRWSDRAFRRGALELFTHPGRLRATVPLLVAGRRLGLERALRPRLGRFPRLAALASLAPSGVTMASATHRLPAHTAAVGAPRGRVGLLQGCVQRVFFSGVNEATVRVLSAEGFDVVAPAGVACCGALWLHSGQEGAALARARAAIAAFEGYDTVVVNAAGCGSAMRDYAHLLADDRRWAGRAEAFSAKVRDVTELLAEAGPRAPRHPVPLRVAYHDACHLAHAQGVRWQPRAVLATIPGLEVAEPAEWEICCGSAGIYNLLEPQAASELGRRKAENLLATGAQAVAAANPGCTLQITAALAAMGRTLPVHHPIELLDASIAGTGSSTRPPRRSPWQRVRESRSFARRSPPRS
jgi:glycolate oxidase iron-sulfur subunit